MAEFDPDDFMTTEQAMKEVGMNRAERRAAVRDLRAWRKTPAHKKAYEHMLKKLEKLHAGAE